MDDRLTGRSRRERDELAARPAGELTFNELLALAGQKLAEKVGGKLGERMPEPLAQFSTDIGRDLALAHTALEDALTRHNSACYRIAGTWKRADPDSLPAQ